MANIIKRAIKIFNGKEWDKYHPETSADQVVYTKPDGTASNVQVELAAQNSAMLDKIYPIGSIYMSVSNVSPETFIGGKWEALQDRFLVGAGNTYKVNSTGGANTVSLSTNNLPAHTHGSKNLNGVFDFTGSYMLNQAEANHVEYTTGIVSVEKISQYIAVNETTAGNDTRSRKSRVRINATHEHTSVGSGTAHENRPPYLAVYMWKRIS